MKPSVRQLLAPNQGMLNRRSFIKSLSGAVPAAGAAAWLSDEELEGAVRNVQRNSIPSQLRITDLRVAVITGAPMTVPLIRIDTNQGISGFGEVRDGGSRNYALLLK